MPTLEWNPTTEQILNLDGVHRRADSFRFELCDRSLTPIGDLHPDRDESAPAIENDVSSTTSRRLRGLKLTRDEAQDVNPIADRMRVYMILQNDVEFLLGTFVFADDSQPVRSWGEERSSELVDFSYILNMQTTRAYGWGRGASIGLIMIFLFQQSGFSLADFARLGDEASRGLSDPLSWQPGATWYQMLTDLGNVVGFAPPWFDRDGRLHMDQPPDPEFDVPTIPAYEDATRVVADSILRSNDLVAAPNDFAVVDSGTDRLRVGRFQLPSSAPHSFANRGYRVGVVENVQGTASQDQANKAAKNLARTRGVAYEWITFSSTADPRHDTYDVIEAYGQRWLETSWSLPLQSGGLMRHTMKRTTYDAA